MEATAFVSRAPGREPQERSRSAADSHGVHTLIELFDWRVARSGDALAYAFVRDDLQLDLRDGRYSTVDLSQGQRKRLALLTAYLEDRPIYVFDEWAADQDPDYKQVFYARLLPELRSRGKTVVVITHDDRYFYLGDRVLKLEDGQVASLAAPAAGA